MSYAFAIYRSHEASRIENYIYICIYICKDNHVNSTVLEREFFAPIAVGIGDLDIPDGMI